jgi:hypothetical protein
VPPAVANRLSETAAAAAVGALTSLWAAVLPRGTARESGCLLVFSHALFVVGNQLMVLGLVPKSNHHATIVFTLSCFEIMKSW